MYIRKLFKLLEYTLQGKKFPLEVLKRKETANITLNSKTFKDPSDVADKEQERVKDEPLGPEPSELYY